MACSPFPFIIMMWYTSCLCLGTCWHMLVCNIRPSMHSTALGCCLFVCLSHSCVVSKLLNKLQLVMNAAVRVVSDTRKFDRGLTNIRCNHLRFLDVPESLMFRLCIMVYKCLHDMAPPYLSELCWQTCNVEGRHQLRSVTRSNLDVPRCRL